MQIRETAAATGPSFKTASRASCHVNLHLRVDYKYNYKKNKGKE
jgi:hypothetical protein